MVNNHRLLNNFKNDFNNNDIFFCVYGPVSQQLISQVISNLEKKEELMNAAKSTMKRLFSIAIEEMQNIIYYSAEIIHTNGQSGNVKNGIVLIGYDNDHYFVSCGNMVRNEDVDTIKRKLSTLKGMSKEEIRQYYMKQRYAEPEEQSKGAGLGFIEIARKSSKSIEFDFTRKDEELSFFSITGFIKGGD